MLTQEYLRAHLHYNPETGIFTNLTNRAPTIKAGTIAGFIRKDGYVVIKICSRAYKAHRLAWLYVYGKFPDQCTDHINGNRGDNRIDNLREATNRQNSENKTKPAKHNKSGYLGVSYRKNDKKWRATIFIDGMNRSLGDFDSPELASEAYIKAKRIHHKFCTI
jgi:hypothetical protein